MRSLANAPSSSVVASSKSQDADVKKGGGQFWDCSASMARIVRLSATYLVLFCASVNEPRAECANAYVFYPQPGDLLGTIQLDP